MKLLIAAVLLAAVLAADAMASAQGALIKKKAKDFSNQNSANQGVAPPPPPAKPATPPAPAAKPPEPNTPKISAVQQQNINQLVADLRTITSKSAVTPEQKQQLKKDLFAAAEGARKPSDSSVTKLANDLSTAWAGQKLSPTEQAYLAKDINVVMNSANIPPADAQAALNSAQTILRYSGITRDAAQKITDNLKAITFELQKK